MPPPEFLSSAPTGVPARRAALRMLDAVLRRGETLDSAAPSALGRVKHFPDKALARAIASETLRWLVDLDALIDSATRQRLPGDAKPRMVLRMMLVQWLRLDTPPHAVISTGLDLIAGGPRRLAHGVFSTLSKRQVTLPDAPTLPDPVRERWGALAKAVAPGLANPPPLDLSLAGDAPDGLEGECLAPGHLRLARGTNVADLAGYQQGGWWVQDLAATIPVRLLGPGEGRRVLDLAAAPGGKTLQLAAAGWDVTALDISEKRLRLLRKNLERTGLAAQVVVADALAWEPEEQFDAILLDAPCTATGTCRRHPDVLHRIGSRQIAEMADLQARLLARASTWLKPGGRMVYAVCSLEREEGEAQVADVTLTPDPIAAEELPAGLAPTASGHLVTHPGLLPEHGGLDGFFVARWRAKA